MTDRLQDYFDHAISLLFVVLSSLGGMIDFGSQLASRWDEQSKFIYPLFLSLLAAAIFWIVFNYLPFALKWKKYRPIAEYDIWQVERKTSLVLSEFLQIVPHRPTVFQNKFRSGEVSEAQIRIIIQNKCLGEAWLYDTGVPGELIPIGRDVRRKALDAERLIDKTIVLKEYVKSNELILLEKTRQCLKRFQVEEEVLANPYTKIGRRSIAPLVSNLDSFCRAVYELHQQLHEVRKILFRYESLEVEQQFRITKALHLFYTEQYRSFIKFHKKISKKYRERHFFDLYMIAMNRRITLTLPSELLEEFVTGKEKPAHFDKSILGLYKESEEFRLILRHSYPSEEIDKQINADERETALERYFLTTNLGIYNYFRAQDTRMPEQHWDRLEPLFH